MARRRRCQSKAIALVAGFSPRLAQAMVELAPIFCTVNLSNRQRVHIVTGCGHDRFVVETLPSRQAPLSIFSRNCKRTRPTVSVGAPSVVKKAPLTVSVYATPLVGEGFGVSGHTRDHIVASSPLSHVTLTPWTLNPFHALATMIFPSPYLGSTVWRDSPQYAYCIYRR